jgi:ankyrin repeat protein
MTDARTAFIQAATWHGDLEDAEVQLHRHPELRSSDIHTAAILGDAAAVERFLAGDRGSVKAKSPPYGGSALVYLTLSKYLRHEPGRTPAFLRAATALLDAGADPNEGFWTAGQHPEHETPLYGAAGVAHNPELTRLLLERGANPNDPEAVYHSPETHDIRAMQVLVETGQLTPENLALMLIRKHDWHDYEGVKYLLGRDVDPNHQWGRGNIPIHHAVARDNSSDIIALLLDHGADPRTRKDGATAIERAARRGRGDLLRLFRERGFPIELQGVDRLIAACALDDAATIAEIREREPRAVSELLAHGAKLLAEFAATWNTAGVRHLLDLGVPVNALYDGDGYFDIAKNSTALHVAAWQSRPDLVQLLVARGADVEAKDAKGRTPLVLAHKARVDSYWMERATPEPERILRQAGATA